VGLSTSPVENLVVILALHGACKGKMVMDFFQIMMNRLVVFEIILVIHASIFCELNLDENYTIHKMITVV
jgi:hypothetical protein